MFGHDVHIRDREMAACHYSDCELGTQPQVSAHAALEIAGVGDDWVVLAEQCTGCGCVYVGKGRNKRRKGYLVNGRWKPLRVADLNLDLLQDSLACD